MESGRFRAPFELGNGASPTGMLGKKNELIQKGYVHKATTAELSEADPKRVWYLPLGVVTNPKKPGKVRIIWDAAAKVQGTSLNDMLLKGPVSAASDRNGEFKFD